MRPATAMRLLAIALSTATASADVVGVNGLTVRPDPIGASLFGPLSASALDLTGSAHFDVLSSMKNDVFLAELGRDDLRVTGISWDLTATTTPGVSLSDLAIAVYNSAGQGVMFSPFATLEHAGSGHVLSGFYDLETMNLGFDLGDGAVFVELLFARPLTAGPVEGQYAEGSLITLELTPAPAPGSLAPLLAAGVIASRRRRA